MPLLEIGRVIRPHGLRGEVVVDLVSTRAERLDGGSRLQYDAPSGRTGELVVASSRPHQHRYLVHFDGVGDRDAAEVLRGVRLLAEPLEAEDGELFAHELIGKVVRDQHGTDRGEVVALEANPASDLLVLGDGALVPLRFVTRVEGGVVHVEAPDGLFP